MLTGYFILKKELNYRGIERVHFEPTFFDELIDKSVKNFKYIWELYSGWRQKLYKKIEENSIGLEASYLIKDENVAKYIVNNIPKEEGKYELIKVVILEPLEKWTYFDSNSFLGYDIAYLGGDFYSAVKNGLLVNPSKNLEEKYLKYLNKHFLFDDEKILSEYIEDFKREVPSGRDSDFYIYALSNVGNASD